MSTSPTIAPSVPLPPPAPTLGQAGAFFRLMVDLGFADALDRLYASQAPEKAEIPTGRPSSMAEAAGVAPKAKPEAAVEDDEEPDGRAAVTVSLGEVLRQVGYHGAYARLGAIIWNVDEETARGLPVEAVRDAFFPFAVSCSAPLAALLDFARDWA